MEALAFAPALALGPLSPASRGRGLGRGGALHSPVRQAGWPSLWPLSLTPGILPSALRASFAVRTRSRRVRGHPRESGSRSAGGRKLLLCTHLSEQKHRAQGALLQKSNSKSIATEVAPTSEGGRCVGAAGFCLCSWLPLPRFAGERVGERGRISLPCAAVSRGRQGRVAGIDRDVDAFSSGQESGRKARPRLANLPGTARQAPSGVAFSLATFSWPPKRK